VFDLFQDLNGFSLDDYKPFSDVSSSLDRLVRFMSAAVADRQRLVRYPLPQRVAGLVGFGGRVSSESVAGLDRNQCPLCVGMCTFPQDHPAGVLPGRLPQEGLSQHRRAAGRSGRMDGGVQRGTHVLKALSIGAKAVGVGRYYLFPLAAAGQAGVERALENLRAEIERDMKLMGCRSVDQLSRDNLRWR